MRYLIAIIIFALASMTACGGSSSAPPASSTPPPSSSTSSSTIIGPPAPLNSASTVAVLAGQPSSGVNILVGSPASTTPPNAADLGVAAVGTAHASAFNTGDVIHQGTTMTVLLFGPGLNGNMQVSIRGPNDIQVSNVVAITASDNTPGISFTATVASNAALGARTVVLQNNPSSNNDVTTFTGGLEVVP